MPAHGEIGTIDLQHETGFRDRLVFVPHGIGDGINVAFEILLVVIAEEQGYDAGRRRAYETANGLYVVQGCFEVLRIDLGSLWVAHRNRGIAGRRLAARTPGIAENTLLQPWELGQVLVDECIAGAAKALEPVLDVSGIARLRHLPVVDK